MKSLLEYINEAIKHLPASTTGIIVFDIDDTILKANPSEISIYKKIPGGHEIALGTDEFAKDPDAADPSKKHLFDYRDFEDPQKVYKSIISGTPLLKNLKMMDAYIRAGYDFSFLTARSCEEVIKKALDEFLLTRTKSDQLQKLGDTFKKTMSHAVNDQFKKYPGRTDAEKKANVLKELCLQYDQVVFVDDDLKNINSARQLNLDNLKVIKAQ